MHESAIKKNQDCQLSTLRWKTARGSVVAVDPFRCRLWHLHERLEEHVTEENCRDEIASFKEHGQLMPVLGRRLRDDIDYDIELIYGARRLFVARLTTTSLLVELRDMSDKEALVTMDMENRQRRDISPYERGLSYARWLRSEYFESQDHLARFLNVSPSQVSRLLKLARLPCVIIGAFHNALDIREGWAFHLATVLEDPQKRQAVIRAARRLGAMSPHPPANEVYRKLLSSSVPGRKPKKLVHDKVITGENGVSLFRIRYQSNSIMLLLPIAKTSSRILDAIEQAVAQILQDSAGSGALEWKDAQIAGCKRISG